jgi:hypothetical protein
VKDEKRSERKKKRKTRKKKEERSKEKTILLCVYLRASTINNGAIKEDDTYTHTIDNVDRSPSSSLSTNFATKRNG